MENNYIIYELVFFVEQTYNGASLYQANYVRNEDYI